MADGSTHSTKEILVSVAWQAELETACFCQIQTMTVGDLDPTEVDLTTLEGILRGRKLERLAAFRQLQSISKQIALLTSGRMSLESFRLPVDVARHAVRPGQRRARYRMETQGVLPVEMQGVLPEDQGPSSVSFIESQDQRTRVPVLPEEPEWWKSVPLLVLGLDQGSIGTAGMAFAMSNNMIHVKFDKIHRAIRDFKNSINHCCRGLFLKTQLHTAYIFSLNHKPFGSGGFFGQKVSMMTIFLQTNDISSPLWEEFREQIRVDLGAEQASDQGLFELLAELESFSKKGALVKLSRWFSWNQLCEEQLKEFHVFKMLLKSKFELIPEKDLARCSPPEKRADVSFDKQSGILPESELEDDSGMAQAHAHAIVTQGVLPIGMGEGSGRASAENASGEMPEDAEGDMHLLNEASRKKGLDHKKELSLLKSALGGFQLAFRLMTEDLFDHANILYRVTQPLWTWYTEQVQKVKSPSDGLKLQADMCLGAWQKDAHLPATLAVLSDSDLFANLTSRGVKQPIYKVLSLTLHLVKNRAWSLSRHGLPPEAYAGILSDDFHMRQNTRVLLMTQHRALLAFENALAAGTPSSQCQKLWLDLQVGVSHPARLVMDTFEAYNYAQEETQMEMQGVLPEEIEMQGVLPNAAGRNVDSPPIHLLKAVLSVFPDSKIVEDVHNKIRTDAKLNKNTRQTEDHIQDVTTCSGVFESRNIEHRAAVTKRAFLEHFEKTKVASRKKDAISRTHKLPAVWHEIMGQKTWQTLSEDTLERASAGWHWLNHYFEEQLGSQGVSLGHGIFSQLMPPLMVVHDVGTSEMWLSLGAAGWASLMWPLLVDEDEADAGTYFAPQTPGGLVWKYIHIPEMWEVLETRVALRKGSACLRFTGVRRQLIVHALLNPKKCLA